MEIKTVNRTIHPDTHDSNNSYRDKIGKRNFYDKLIVNISHDKKGFINTYVFDGKEIAGYESIHFKAREVNGEVKIEWVQNLKFRMG
jgi:hypothetical protein